MSCSVFYCISCTYIKVKKIINNSNKQ
jgi:hypothetical protein